MVAPRLMRDAFIDRIYELSGSHEELYFVSADFGAKALDRFRADHPNRFLHAGIAEQHMVDLASGLALSGKTVILYAMAPFVTLRCIEQTKCVLSSMNLPVTLVAVGVGLGYDHATLTHFTPEDIAVMRSMNHMEVWSPGDEEGAEELANLVVEEPKLRYVRLERNAVGRVYGGGFASLLPSGIASLRQGTDVAIVACGYMTHKALRAAAELDARGISAGVIDVFRVKPIDASALRAMLADYRAVVTVEEQLLQGGFSAAVLEALVDSGPVPPLKRVGIRDGFEVVNGDRDHLHALYGIDVPDIVRAAEEVL